MALGLLGSALAGGGEAVQQNATDKLKRMHDEAILRMRQEFQTSEREAGQEFQTSEREAGQEFTAEQGRVDREFRAGESAADRAQRLELARMQEDGANSRTQMGLIQQGMTEDGETVMFNPVTGDRYDPPEGVSFGDGGELSPRAEQQLKELQSRRSMLADQLDSDMLEPDQAGTLRTRIQEIDAQIDAMLGMEVGASGGNPGSEIADILGLSGETDRDTSEGAPPPRPRSTAEEDLLSQEREREARQQSERESRQMEAEVEQALSLAEDLQNFRTYESSMRMGDSDEWDQRRRKLTDQGRERMERLMEAYNATRSSATRERLMEAMNQLRKGGVPLPQQ